MPFSTDIFHACTNGAVYCLFKWSYDVTNGIFPTALLLSCCIVLLIATQNFGMPRAYGFASFVGLIGALFLVTLKLMPWSIGSMFIIAGVIGFVVLINNER